MGRGRFEGVSDVQWSVLEPIFPQNWNFVGPKGGRPPTPFRKIVNSVFWVCICGAGWTQIPHGEAFAPRSTTHRWMQKWMQDGTWERVLQTLIQIADLHGLINWERCYIDGTFSPGAFRWRR
jgi:transposase